jgi:hypothetical protein
MSHRSGSIVGMSFFGRSNPIKEIFPTPQIQTVIDRHLEKEGNNGVPSLMHRRPEPPALGEFSKPRFLLLACHRPQFFHHGFHPL